MEWKDRLIARIQAREAVVGVVGLGYVGLPLALRFAKQGFRVLGFDIDHAKIEALNAGRSYIAHIPTAEIAEAHKDRKLEATADFARAAEVDALILCVPTPLNRNREPDLSFVTNTVESLVPHLRKGQLLSLESTTWPGTTDEEVAPRIRKRGFEIGSDFFVVFSPEREDPGNARYSLAEIPKLCGGTTAACLEAGAMLYGAVVARVVGVSSTRAAEMTKLLENIHRAVNIGLVNELKVVADAMGLDIREVIDAAATKPFGFTPYYPGPGLGGHCLPIDPFYLTWKAREYGVTTRFIELAGEVNTAMPKWVVGKLTDALNERGKPLKGAKVLVLGIAYKKNVGDTRESPGVELMELLRRKGVEVSYSDPFAPKFPPMREHSFDLASVELSPLSVASFDCVLVAVDHGGVDYAMIRKHARLIVDTRGVYREPAINVVPA